jgi:hypothetical protein
MSFYPSWKCRLIVRLEEFDSGVLAARIPQKLTKNLNGIRDDGTDLEVVEDPENPGRFLVQKKGGEPLQGTLVPETSSDDLTHSISGIVPKRFDWKQNGFRTAEELRVTIRFDDFPIDPRCIRSCAVVFYLGTLTAVEYAQGTRGLVRGDVFGGNAANAGEPMNVVADTYVDASGVQRTNERFTGWVDKWKMTWSDDVPTIELECRDNTQLLLSQMAPPRLVIGGKLPLDQAIATYLANFPQFSGLTVEYRGPDGTTAPELGKVLAGTAYRPELGPPPAKGSGEDLAVWDYLTDVCGAVGLACYVDGTRVVIARPGTILSGNAQTRLDDPYRTRKLPEGEFPARAFIYGRNLVELSVSREFATRETKNIEVRCFSTRRKKLLVARYPKKNSRIASGQPGDSKSDNKWTVVRVSGVESEAILQQIAEDYYHGRNRNEIETHLKTKAFSSFGGGNDDPDILDMKPGDPIEILVDRSATSSVATGERLLSAAATTEQMLLERGFAAAFARAYGRVYQNAGFQRLYRVRELAVTGDIDEGVTFEITAANFVQVRGELTK